MTIKEYRQDEHWEIEQELNPELYTINSSIVGNVATHLTREHAVTIVNLFNTYNVHPIQKYRNLKGITQQQLADDLGCCLNSVKFWETGRREPCGKWKVELKKRGVEV